MKFHELHAHPEHLADYDRAYSTVEDDHDVWFNRHGQYHRDGAPAMIERHGVRRVWYCNGQEHRLDGPSRIERVAYEWDQWAVHGIIIAQVDHDDLVVSLVDELPVRPPDTPEVRRIIELVKARYSRDKYDYKLQNIV